MNAKMDSTQKKDITPNQPSQASEETVIIPLNEMFQLRDHPFSVNDDELMEWTISSIESHGVLTPALVRPREDGGYEIIAGHRRHRACELAGLTAMPCIVRNVDYDTAVILMVDSNIQRENTPISERAKAIKMKYEAVKRQGARTDLTSPKFSAKLRSDDEIGRQMGMSGDTVRNYMALADFVPELLQMVDDKKIALTPAYQLASLTQDEQRLLLDTINSEQTTPSLSQAQRIKKLSQSGGLNEDTMLAIMSEEKKTENNKIVLTTDTLRKYFPRSYTPQRMERTIIKLLDTWAQKRQLDQTR